MTAYETVQRIYEEISTLPHTSGVIDGDKMSTVLVSLPSIMQILLHYEAKTDESGNWHCQ